MIFNRHKAVISGVYNIAIRHYGPQGSKFQSLTQKFRKADKIPDKYQLVYRTSFENYLEGAKYFGAGATVSAAVTLPILILNSETMSRASAGGISISSLHEMFGMWSFIALHALACLKIVHVVPIRIYYSESEDNFLFVFHHLVKFWEKVVVSAEPGDLLNIPSKYEHLRHV